MKARRSRLARYAPALPALFLLVLGVLLPCLFLFRVSLSKGGGQSGFGIGGGLYQPGTWTIEVYRRLVTDPYFWEVTGFTLVLALTVAGLCLVLAYPLALWLWQARGLVKWVSASAVILPKLANLLVTVYGLKLILGDYGPVNSFLRALGFIEEPLALQNNLTGTLIAKTLIILPYTVLFLWAGLERMDRSLIEAARGLGAGTGQILWGVVWPLSLPAFGAAALVSFIWGLGAYVSPFLMGSPDEITLAVDVQRQMFENMNWPRAAAGSGVLLLFLTLASIIWLVFSITVFRPGIPDPMEERA